MSHTKDGRLLLHWKIIVLIAPFLAAGIALCIGRIGIRPGDVARALLGSGSVDALTRATVLTLRLPRIAMAAVVGAGLSVAGCAFQSLFANPLATPDTLGVASGASFGAALGILLGFRMAGIQAMALLMGGAAVALTWLTGLRAGRRINTLVLSGIMIGSLFTALVSLVKYTADQESQLPAITYWLMGGLDKANARTLALGAVPVVLGVAVLWLVRWRLDLLPLAEEEARASGVNLGALRGVTVLCATAITAACVSMCGQVGWVGLLIPHMCRMKFGSSHMALIPASVSLGAVFLIAVDTVARSVSAAEIPVSILTAIIGAPCFLYLMRKSGGWQF